MVFEQIESLKHDYTDKYVVVDESRPELARFKGAVGQVKTVNMSGRALVEFNLYDNIGWYDIAPEFLKVVEAPPPPAKEEKKPAKEPAKGAAPAKAAVPGTGEKKLSPLEMARMQGAGGAKPAAAPAESKAAPKSTAEILAAARTKKGAAPAAPAAEKPAAPKPASGGKPSVADILAMARGGAAKAPAPAAEAPAVKEPPVEEAPAEEPAAAVPAPAPPAAKAPAGDRPKAGELSVEQIMAWCRQHDAKS